MTIWDFLDKAWPDPAGKLDTIINTQEEHTRMFEQVIAKAEELKKDAERVIADLAAAKAEIETLKAQVGQNAETLATIAKLEEIIGVTDAAVEAASPEPPPVA